MSKYIPTFGIEIHTEVIANTKAFSPSESKFAGEPNTHLNPIDLAHPGSKPTVNDKVVESAYRLCKSLDMDIADKIVFDRKNYYYPDLAKGVQITQYFKPIGRNGKFTIILDEGKTKDISITDIHIEEDTAKQSSKDGLQMFDFNRAGNPLLEVVTGHEEFETIEEVVAFVKQFRDHVVLLGINDGKLEEGSFRVDVNFSIRKEGETEYGNRVEIKNLNSFSNIRKSLEWEMNKHIKLIESNEEIQLVTKRFDEETQSNITMRLKQTHDDYFFIPEANIIPIKLSEETKNKFDSIRIIESQKVRSKLVNELSQDQIDAIFSSPITFEMFEKVSNETSIKQTANFISGTLVNLAKEEGIELSEIKINEKDIVSILNLLSESKLTKSEASKLVKKSHSGSDISSELNDASSKEMVSDDEIMKLIEELLDANPDKKEEMANRPESVSRFLMGQIMKKTQGKVNPKEANRIINEYINK